MATFDDFLKLDIRVGEIVEVEDFPKAKNPSYKLQIDFGFDVGIKASSAQITNYPKEDLIGKQILGVINFPPRNIAGFMSEVLVLGVPSRENEKQVSLLTPSKKAVLGSKVY